MGYASPRRFLNKSYLFIKEYMVIDELSCSIDIDADPGFHFYPQLLKKEKEKKKSILCLGCEELSSFLGF